MKYFSYIIILFLFTTTELLAQSISDSLYVLKIDSIIVSRDNKDYWGTDLIQKQIEDSTDNRTVISRTKNGILIDISYLSRFDNCENSTFSPFGECENNATFHLVDNSLVMVEYRLSDPDVQSSMPPTTLYRFYFKDNLVVFQLTWNHNGGPRHCNSYSIDKKDFLKELSYYRQFYLKN